jgi:adenylate cyclase
MIVADDVDAVVEACIELIRATADGHCELPAIHAGVAFGRAVTREGDWHGSPVNMASRLADAAPAGRIFATDAVRDACTEIRGWTDVGTYGVKGIDGPVHVSCLAPNPTE